MLLQELAGVLPVARVYGDPRVEVTGLAYDSRQVQPGYLFIAVSGFVTDGHRYIEEAVGRGAVACLVEKEGLVPPGITEVWVPNTRWAGALLAARFYEFPSTRLRLIGVTGTNGKTTTTFLGRQVLERAVGPTGLIGTIETVVGQQVFDVQRTTPEAVDLERLLSEMVAAGNRQAVMEVSSHSLSLYRVEGVEFDVAVFTNLTQDHLDFHHSFDEYLAAKKKLFSRLGEGAAGAPKPGPKGAVVNADDPYHGRIIERCRVPVLTYAIEAPADVQARDVRVEPDGVRYTVRFPGGELPLKLRLTGRFNVYNSLAAFGLGLVEGIDPALIAQALEEAPRVPGRFEVVPGGRDFTVVVDYAHTPDGLENVLRTARDVTGGRVLVVFGAGGDRDRGKRPRMGALAARLADYVILTSDNPRSEDPQSILRDIEAGVREVPGARYELEVDREAAIARAIELAGPGDLVLIAGKGHETYQIFQDRTIHFDDREVAARLLAERS